jgi:hypothetical protein
MPGLLRVFSLTLTAAALLPADVISIENTIPNGNLFLQPPELTGAAPVFGLTEGVVLADAFTAPTNAKLFQVSVVINYEFFPAAKVVGTSPMLLTLLGDNHDSPGAPIESWMVPFSPADVNLTVISVNSVTHPLLVSGKQYWLSEVPTDPIHTGIGWGLASSGYPGIELPIAESETGTNSGWMPTTLNLANEFQILGTTVPEPGVFWICGVVLLWVMAKRHA